MQIDFIKKTYQYFKYLYFKLVRNLFIRICLVILTAFLLSLTVILVFSLGTIDLINMILLLTGLSSILAALLCFRKQFSFNLVLIGYIVLSPAFPILLFPLVLIICYQIYLSLLKRKFKKLKKLAETSPEDLAGLKTTTVTIHIKRGDED